MNDRIETLGDAASAELSGSTPSMPWLQTMVRRRRSRRNVVRSAMLMVPVVALLSAALVYVKNNQTEQIASGSEAASEPERSTMASSGVASDEAAEETAPESQECGEAAAFQRLSSDFSPLPWGHFLWNEVLEESEGRYVEEYGKAAAQTLDDLTPGFADENRVTVAWPAISSSVPGLKIGSRKREYPEVQLELFVRDGMPFDSNEVIFWLDPATLRDSLEGLDAACKSVSISAQFEGESYGPYVIDLNAEAAATEG